NSLDKKDKLLNDLNTSIQKQITDFNNNKDKMQDNARLALNSLITEFGGMAFDDLSPEAQAQMNDLEKAAGYPPGIVKEGMQTVAQQKNQAAQEAAKANQELAKQRLEETKAQNDASNAFRAATLELARDRYNLSVLKAQQGLTTKSGQDKVAGTDVPADIASDVEDVLSGRNTLYNIRQTMGRTNGAAAYMKSMRDAIKSIDNKFDFVASDAGGKFVSTPYYQKSIAAIDNVLPDIKIATDLSDQVDRLGVKGVDDLLQKGNIQIDNQKVTNFHQAQKLLA